MEFKKNKRGNWELRFNSNINIDDGHTNHPQGEMDSEMELFQDGNKAPTGIEWIVYNKDGDTEFVEGIGLEFDGRELEGYDGVFELPIQAIKLIRKSGYTVPKHFEE